MVEMISDIPEYITQWSMEEAVCNYCNRLYVLEGYEKD